MAKIADLLAAGPTTSLEFFPPKTDQGVVSLQATIDQLAVLGQRAGLLACGDIRLALEDFSAEAERASPTAGTLALIRFVLSEMHGSLRRELGWAT